MSARSKWPHPFTPEELQERIADAAQLPDETRDNVLARIDALETDEVLALVRQLAAVERGRRAISSAAELTVAEIEDAIAYLELQRRAKR